LIIKEANLMRKKGGGGESKRERSSYACHVVVVIISYKMHFGHGRERASVRDVDHYLSIFPR